MVIRRSQLGSAYARYRVSDFPRSLTEARLQNHATAFLSHSHSDRELAQGLQVMLAEHGWTIYIDWQDTTMPEVPNWETAEKIKNKIVQLDWFLFLATENSTSSRWCPWEIGFADRAKLIGKILIIPTTDPSGEWYGNEYLQLYRQIVPDDAGRLVVRDAAATFGGIPLQHL